VKKVLIVLFALICASGLVFAADKAPAKQKASSNDDLSWMTSYNDPGKVNAYGSVGLYGYGLDASVAGEYILNKFNIGPVPLEWGLEGRGVMGFGSYSGYSSWVDWGIAPMATLHWGVNFGKPWRFDAYIGAGAGFYGTTGTYWSNGNGLGFASWDGVAWYFADKMALIAEGGYIGHTSSGGIGLKMNL
jgi:hypothetical protein